MSSQFLIHITRQGPREAILKLPAEYPFFRGHFPERPILPGAIILEISREFLLNLCSSTTSSELCIRKAKFAGAVLPETAIRLVAHPLEESGREWEVRWTEEITGKEIAILSVALG